MSWFQVSGDRSATRRFLVTSPGYTATKWLAAVLNAHPQVYCSHSAGSSVLDREYSLTELKALAEEKWQVRDQVPLDSFWDRLEHEGGEHRIVGNVHRYNLTALHRNLRRWDSQKGFQTLNLIRHPVSWVASGTAQLTRMAEGVEQIRKILRRHMQRYRLLYASLGVVDPQLHETQAFCYLCFRFTVLADEAHIPGAEHVRMEEMTSSLTCLLEVVRKLTGENVEPDEAWLQKMVQGGPIHQHRKTSFESSREQYGLWTGWQQRVFRSWAESSRIFVAYRVYRYERPWEPSKGMEAREERGGKITPCPLEQIDATAQRTFDPVAMRVVSYAHFLGKRRRQVLATLHEHLGQRGLQFFQAESSHLWISPGLRGGVPSLPDVAFLTSSEDAWKVAVYHPLGQDRSPALGLHQGKERVFWTVNYKGAGVRDLKTSFVVRANRCPAWQQSISETIHKPVDILMDHPDHEYLSHRLIGGAQLLPTLAEIWNAVGWHGLLLAIDGRPAATCIPLRVMAPLELWVRKSGRRDCLPLWDYWTSPEVMSVGQLRHLVRESWSLSEVFRPDVAWKRRRFLRLLEQDPEALQTRHALRRWWGERFTQKRKPIVYEHVTRGKLRSGHLWWLLSHDGEMEASLEESGLSVTRENMYGLMQRIMHEVYACNGFRFRPLPLGELSEDLMTKSGRFACLRSWYHHNRDDADALMRQVGQTGGRTLGALHGSGGHCLGRRLRLLNRKNQLVLDGNGLAIRVGAPGGGCTAHRNMTVCGEWVDTSHLYNPGFAWKDPLARKLRDQLRSWQGSWDHSFVYHPMLSALSGKTGLVQGTFRNHLEWGLPDQCFRFQKADWELAQESMRMLGGVVMGESAMVPDPEDRIGALRVERKKLEDSLARAQFSEKKRGMLDQIMTLEKKIGKLRKKLVPSGHPLIVQCFQQAYFHYEDLARRMTFEH